MKRLLLFFCMLWITSASHATPTAPATLLFFAEHEPGSEPYRTRMIITAGFVRLDGGENSEDFILFDRADGAIYSVSAVERRILVIPPRAVDARPPADFRHEVVRDSATYPAVQGHKVSRYELLTNGRRCYDLYAAKGLLPDALAALRQYRQALAGQQAQTLASMPADVQSPCDLANNVFLPARHLQHGFPVRLEDMTGRKLELMDYVTQFRAPAAMFRLPPGYKRLALEEPRKK